MASLELRGSGRDTEAPGGALVLYFDRPPTDDEMRAIHNLVKWWIAPEPINDNGNGEWHHPTPDPAPTVKPAPTQNGASEK